MSTLAEFTTPQIEIGECIEVLAGTSNNGAVISTTQGDFVLAANNVYNQADYPDLYARLGLIAAYPWTPVPTVGTVGTIRTSTYGNGLFLYAGDTGILGTSTNGITWTVRTSGTTSQLVDLGYGNGLYVYAGGGGVLASSTDGTTWTARTSGTASQINALTYGNDLYVYAGAGGSLATSANAITWTGRTSGTTNALLTLTYGNGLYVYGGAAGVLRTSTNGITWNAATSGTTSSIRALTYGNGVYVYAGNGAIGSGGIIRSSTDGITWTAATASPALIANDYFYDIAYGNGLFVAVTALQFTYTSENGTNWRSEPYAINLLSIPYTITYGNGKYVMFSIFGDTNLPTFYGAITSRTATIAEYSLYYDVNTQFLVPPVNMANLGLNLTTFGANSSPQYLTYMRAK